VGSGRCRLFFFFAQPHGVNENKNTTRFTQKKVMGKGTRRPRCENNLMSGVQGGIGGAFAKKQKKKANKHTQQELRNLHVFNE
jgi:hypothetical protein